MTAVKTVLECRGRMAYWYVQALDEHTLEERELLLVADTEAQIEDVLVRALGETFRVRYRYAISDVVCDVVEGLYEDFLTEGQSIAKRSTSTLRRAELSLFQEGQCIAGSMTSLNRQAVQLLIQRDAVPAVHQAMALTADRRQLVQYDLQGIQDFITYCLHEGIRDLIGKVAQITQNHN